ncbi:polyketide synthase dehydratase domain-containing protein, partial [Dactylosporangium sucinum]|uniref:polyketide synthase dehydratase domain-containing protein n=1 Tax=Dactylosporangium sucinum TaxID=1424081 RepID=UPI00167EC648
MDVSPDGVLTSMIAATAPDATVVPTLRTGHLVNAAAGLYAAGVELDWTAVLGGASAPAVPPTYAFEHTHYWLNAPGAGDRLVDAAISFADGQGCVLTGRISLATQPWLADHVIAGTTLLAGTGLVELAVRAGDESGLSVVRELTLQAPLVVPAHGGVELQVTVGADGDLAIHSRAEGGGDWTRHATGVLGVAGTVPAAV